MIQCLTHNQLLVDYDSGGYVIKTIRKQLYCHSGHAVYFDSGMKYCNYCNTTRYLRENCRCDFHYSGVLFNDDLRNKSIEIQLNNLRLNQVYINANYENDVSCDTPVILLPNDITIPFDLIIRFLQQPKTNSYFLSEVFIRGFSPYQSFAQKVTGSDKMFIKACFGTVKRNKDMSKERVIDRAKEIVNAYEAVPQGQLSKLPDHLANPIRDYINTNHSKAKKVIWSR